MWNNVYRLVRVGSMHAQVQKFLEFGLLKVKWNELLDLWKVSLK